MVNYYNLLEISQNASKDEISAAIRKARRTWNNRANNPDAKIRAEAEQRVREIAEAEGILLNDSKREEYNRQLEQSHDTPTNGSEEECSEDWEDEFFRAYDRDLTDYAAQVAQKAIRANERNGRAWFLYGEALRKGGNSEGAIGPFQRASVLLPDDARVFRQLGFAYYDSDRLSDALQAFYDASRCDPDDCEYLKFIIRVQHMGTYAFMHVYNMGGSKNYRAENVAAAGGFMGAISKAGGLFGGRNAKLNAEEQYYTILNTAVSASQCPSSERSLAA